MNKNEKQRKLLVYVLIILGIIVMLASYAIPGFVAHRIGWIIFIILMIYSGKMQGGFKNVKFKQTFWKRKSTIFLIAGGIFFLLCFIFAASFTYSQLYIFYYLTMGCGAIGIVIWLVGCGFWYMEVREGRKNN